MQTVEDIRKLISRAKLEQALEAAQALAASLQAEDIEDTLRIISGNFHTNERNNRIGLITPGEYARARANVSHGLLGVLSDLEDQHPGGTASAGGSPEGSDQGGRSADDGVTTIVFLASNPSDTAKLQLTTEHSRVTTRLQDAPAPEQFRLKFKQAVTPSEFTQYLFLEKPDIVHFSGHGDRKKPDVQALLRAGRPEANPAAEQAPDESGIFLYDEEKRNAHFVGTPFLKRTFRSMTQSHRIPIKAVIFNACHSEEQAKAVAEYVPFVVGTSWSVRDDAAIAFATGFYFGVAQGMTIDQAVDHGINNALAYNEPEDRFILYKDGVKVEW